MTRSIAILLAVTLVTLTGDYLIKRAASLSNGLPSISLAGGTILYAASAIGWFYLMRAHTLSMVATMFAASIVIGLSAMGVILYGERLGSRELLGIALAIGAVIVMHGK